MCIGAYGAYGAGWAQADAGYGSRKWLFCILILLIILIFFCLICISVTDTFTAFYLHLWVFIWLTIIVVVVVVIVVVNSIWQWTWFWLCGWIWWRSNERICICVKSAWSLWWYETHCIAFRPIGCLLLCERLVGSNHSSRWWNDWHVLCKLQ